MIINSTQVMHIDFTFADVGNIDEGKNIPSHYYYHALDIDVYEFISKDEIAVHYSKNSKKQLLECGKY